MLAVALAVLIPGIAILLLLWEKRGVKLPGGVLGIAAGSLAFAVIGFGWFVLVYQRLGPEPLAYFFLRENLQRFAAETYDIGRPIWFYLPAYLAEGLPWSPFLPIALARLLRSADAQERAVARFLSLWPLVVLVPLSLSRGKIDYYLLPFYPPACLALGRLFADARWGRLERAWARGALLSIGLTLAFAARFPGQLPGGWLPSPGVLAALSWLVALALLGLLLAGLRPSPARVLGALAGCAAGVFLALVGVLLPPYRAAQPNDAIVADVARERRYVPELRVAFCEDPVRAPRDLLFELRLPAEQRCDLWATVATPAPYLLLLDQHEWNVGRAQGMRHVATYRYLPATVLHARSLLEGVRPGRLALFANFETTDPVAVTRARRRWRRYVQGLERADARARGELRSRRRATPTPSER